MIPWPSSSRIFSGDFLQQDREFRLLKKELGAEIRYWRNCCGHLVNLLKRQRAELDHQKELLLKDWPNEIKDQQDTSSASPMYVFTRDTLAGHRISNVNVMTHIS